MTTEDGCAGGTGLVEEYSAHFVPSNGGECKLCGEHSAYLYGGTCPECCPPPPCDECGTLIRRGERYFHVLEGPEHGLYCAKCVTIDKPIP